MEAPKQQEFYTYADYCTWGNDERWELIDGRAYSMAPPSTAHQRVCKRFIVELELYLDGKPCELFHAPFGVRLNAETNDDTVVEPDIIVVCDETKIDEKGCNGAPDLVIEVLSPSTSGYDKVLKYNKYYDAGVKEYWLVDPADSTVIVSLFAKGVPAAHYGKDDTIPVGVLPGCTIDLKEIF